MDPAEVDRVLADTKSSHYSHKKHVDEEEGVFDFDCSGFVVYALTRSVPDAWRDYLYWTGDLTGDE